MWLYDLMMWAGIASIAIGFGAALVLMSVGRGGPAVKAAWNGWGVGIALLILAALAMSGSADDADEALTLPTGGLSGEEAMMVPAFHDYAAGISAAAAHLEGLVGGGGEITAAEEDEARELGYAFADADPEILYVPHDSDALYDLQERLSRACGSFGEACDELTIFGDRPAARAKYREGVEQLDPAIRLLKELESLAPAE
ncbi:MAG: hypothetical protein V2J16_10195 [Thermoleophilia bacterium]|jgi:hypothetical protein|nr:hypothetical protein [Thermoleophilia bacterium]